MGATALDLKYFRDNNVWSIPPFNTSMNCQLEWFQEVKDTICSSPQGISMNADRYIGSEFSCREKCSFSHAPSMNVH